MRIFLTRISMVSRVCRADWELKIYPKRLERENKMISKKTKTAEAVERAARNSQAAAKSRSIGPTDRL